MEAAETGLDPSGDGDADRTSLHLRRASSGEAPSRDWIVARFTPLLRVQAEYRLRGRLRGLHEPDDLVNEVWAVALPRLGDLRAREGHLGPVLLRFLATTMLHKANELLRRELRGGGRAAEGSIGGISRLPAELTSVTARAARDETCAAVQAAIARLKAADREVLVLRGVEQLSNAAVARTLGLEPSTAAMRYRAALQRLRARLPGSVFDDLPDG